MSFEERVEEAIPNGTIYIFTSVDETKPSLEDYDLPYPDGKSGGACTSALLQTLWNDSAGDDDDDDSVVRYTWLETLEAMKEKINDLRFVTITTISNIPSNRCC